MLIAEVFGRGTENVSDEATLLRQSKTCPFRGTACTKSSKAEPIGVCSLVRKDRATAICPVRFLESDVIFKSAAEIAFGKGVQFAVFPEIRLLHIENEGTGKVRKIGKVDFLLGKIVSREVVDFAALEVQATYFSGKSIRPALTHYLKYQKLNLAISDRRPDFRSSAQKRLMPQLQLKVPVFRRWGKKFFVVVDSEFFGALPEMKSTSTSNSELIWLAFPIQSDGHNYSLQAPIVHGTQWDDVVAALREGQAPEPHEILLELQEKLATARVLNT